MSATLWFYQLGLTCNSEAYELWSKKEFNKLDQHLKALEVKNQELMRRYEPKEKKDGN